LADRGSHSLAEGLGEILHGLTAAAVLAESGVDVRVIDERSGPVAESRAAIVHVRTLETWDLLGVASPAIEHGVPIREVTVSVAGRRLVRFPLAGRGAGAEESSFDHALALPQDRTERILAAALERRGASVAWRTRLLGYEQRDGGVCAVVRRPDGTVGEAHARFLVGADGARSLVRRVAGIDFPGSAYAPTAFLADVDLSPPPPAGAVHLNLAKGGFVGILSLGPGHYRLFGALSPDDEARFGAMTGEARADEQTLQWWFDEFFGVRARIAQVRWTSTYRIHHRLATRFRSGDVFLAGDAAHVHAPAGGQGMNLGVGDAMNLGWKLAAVLNGSARPALLDTYEEERRAAARAVLRNTDRGFELEVSRNPLLLAARRTVGPLALRALVRLPASRRMIFRLFAQTWIGYRFGGAATQHPLVRDGLRAGDRIPPGLLTAGGRGPIGVVRHQPLLVVDQRTPGQDARHIAELIGRFVPAHEVRTVRRHTPAGRALAASGPPRIILSRPDGHAGYVGPPDDLPALRTYLERWYRETGR
jgi:2-polyprenyl-6-methoxyphenol hydroxylase-like FAD-dependent oxidoreductase